MKIMPRSTTNISSEQRLALRQLRTIKLWTANSPEAEKKSPAKGTKRKHEEHEGDSSEYDASAESAAFGLLMLMDSAKKSKSDSDARKSVVDPLTPPKSPPKPTRIVKLVSVPKPKRQEKTCSPSKRRNLRQSPEKLTVVWPSVPKSTRRKKIPVDTVESSLDVKPIPLILKRSPRLARKQVAEIYENAAFTSSSTTALVLPLIIEEPMNVPEPQTEAVVFTQPFPFVSTKETLASRTESSFLTDNSVCNQPDCITHRLSRVGVAAVFNGETKPCLAENPVCSQREHVAHSTVDFAIQDPARTVAIASTSKVARNSVSLMSTVEHLRQAKAKHAAQTKIASLNDKLNSLSRSAAKVIPGGRPKNVSLVSRTRRCGNFLISYGRRRGGSTPVHNQSSLNSRSSKLSMSSRLPISQPKPSATSPPAILSSTPPAPSGTAPPETPARPVISVAPASSAQSAPPTSSATSTCSQFVSKTTTSLVAPSLSPISTRDSVVLSPSKQSGNHSSSRRKRAITPANGKENTAKRATKEAELVKEGPAEDSDSDDVIFLGTSEAPAKPILAVGDEIYRNIFNQMEKIGNQIQSIEKVDNYEKDGISVNEIHLLSSAFGKSTRLKIRLTQNLPKLPLANPDKFVSANLNQVPANALVPNVQQSMGDGDNEQNTVNEVPESETTTPKAPTPADHNLTVDIEVTKVKIENDTRSERPAIDVVIENIEPVDELKDEIESDLVELVEETEEVQETVPDDVPNNCALREEESQGNLLVEETEETPDTATNYVSSEKIIQEVRIQRNIFDDIAFAAASTSAVLNSSDVNETEKPVPEDMRSNQTNGTDPLQCVVCERAFKNSWVLSSHLKRHAGEHPYKCDICGRNSTSIGNLRSHLRMHTGDKPFACSQCPKAFKSQVGLSYHQMSHSGEKPFKCSKCDKAFTRHNIMKEHMKIHEGGNKCEVCNKCFSSTQSYREHLRIHSEERPFECQHCSRTFKHAPNLKKHLRVHQGDYQCAHCKLHFSLPGELEGHGCPTMYQCLHCPLEFDVFQEYLRHQRTHRAENGSFECEICGKRSNLRNTHKLHMRLHNNERPYECKTCGKTFVASSHLNRHRRIHTGEKPYQCDVCEKRFARHDEKTVHMKLHSNVMLVICQRCGEYYDKNARCESNPRKKKLHNCCSRRGLKRECRS